MRPFLLTLALLSSIAALAMSPQEARAVYDMAGNGNVDAAVQECLKIARKSKGEAEPYLIAADLLKRQGKHKERIEILQKALTIKKIDNPTVIKTALAESYCDLYLFDSADSVYATLPQTGAVSKKRQSISAAKQLYQNPIDVEIKAVHGANTPYDDIWPFVSNDGSKLFYTVTTGKTNAFNNSLNIQEKIYIADLSNASAAVEFLSVKDVNAGAQCLSADGKYLFFTLCDNFGGCHIMYAERNPDGKYANAKIAIKNKEFRWQSSPALSSDMTEIYFSAIKDPRTDSRDIYMCRISRDDKGELVFSAPMSLGGNVNSRHDEMAPFVDPYGSRLYFASDRSGGMGGFDIYYCDKEADGTWGEAKNMGYPINTWANEFGLAVTPDASKAYISSNVYNGEYSEHKDIYEITLPQHFRLDAPFETAGDNFTLTGVNFAVNDSTLTAESLPKLDSLATFLAAHPGYNIVIEGHCDDSGTAEHNLQLSLARARSARSHLISKGINPTRISCEGYGSTRPISDSLAANRRIEVRIRRAYVSD